MENKRITIDPGHGGSDPGAVGSAGTHESKVTLKVAKKVEELLKDYNVDVLLTRYTDVKISLPERVRLSNEYNSDLFVSIHINSASNKSATGVETYYNVGSTRGFGVAKIMQSYLKEHLGTIDRGVKEGSFQVIRATKAPACLTELGFISNPDEEKLINTDRFINDASTAIAQSIILYLNLIKKNSHIIPTDVSAWAESGYTFVKENNLSDGTNPKGIMTREEMWTMIKRYHDTFR